MKKYKINRFPFCQAISLMILLSITSCEDFVEADPPQSQLSSITVFEDVSTADAALANVYASLRSKAMVTGELQGLSILLGNYSDELIPYGLNQPEQPFFQNNLVPNDPTIQSLWNDAYNLIYATNAILEGLDASSSIAAENKDRLSGEALFIRSYLHFYLLNLFGEVPYVTTTDYRQNTVIGKMPASSMYPLLIEDLDRAKGMLPEQYTDTQRIKPNKSVAAALLARIYLYTGDWNAASELASEVIVNTGLYQLSTDINTVFLKESPSTIWQLIPSAQGWPTLEGQNFVFTMGPPPNRALNPLVLEAFEPGDLRLSNWIGSVSDGSETWYFPHKYKQYTTEGSSTEYSILFRLEEMYLIRAEARTHSGDLIGARDDLDIIRNRAGLADTEADAFEALLDAIIRERRCELFTELGHRWFDLKRTGRANTVLSATKPGWQLTDIDWPLPQAELLLNPNLLPQNDGY